MPNANSHFDYYCRYYYYYCYYYYCCYYYCY